MSKSGTKAERAGAGPDLTAAGSAKDTHGKASKDKKAKKELAGLRRDIDDLDKDIHKLIRKRAKLVAKVGASKQDAAAPVHRPGREAQVLRKLVSRHKGEFPAASLLAVWREIITASVRIQSDFRVAVPGRGAWLAALARDHFGAATPVTSASNPLSAVTDGLATVALLAGPGSSGAGLWWRRLAVNGDTGLSVLWRLPFAGAGREAYVVGRGLPGPSGDDLTWIAAELPASAPDPKGMRTVSSFAGRAKAGGPNGAAGAPTALRLLEAEGYISAADAARALPAGAAAGPVHWLGAFPRPLGDLESG